MARVLLSGCKRLLGWKRAPRAIAFASSLALANATFLPPATAQENATIHIPAGPLSAALAELSRQTGISIGMDGAYPPVRTRRLSGHMPVQTALRKLLAGSGLVARQVGEHSFRLERAAPPPPAAEQQADVYTPSAEIIVTASKRTEALSSLPFSLSVVRLPDGPNPHGLLSTTDIAQQTEGLALTNLGPGLNRQFVRGVADSAFNGPSQSTVSLQIDDSRVTFNAPDPDLRLADVERVEVLKGPQGPLYGTGALGGVYHIVTRKPDLDQPDAYATLEGSMVESGGIGGAANAVINLPMLQDRAGVRLVGYGAHEGGWVDNPDKKGVNSSRLSGGRATLRFVPADEWTLDLTAAAQWLRTNDSQYVFAPGARTRSGVMPEPHDNDFQMAAATLHGRLGEVDLTVASSVVKHEVTSIFDASASAAAFNLSGNVRYDDERRYHLFDNEIRFSRGTRDRLSWLAGFSYLSADYTTDGNITALATDSSSSIIDARQKTHELAAFGEVSAPVARNVRATAGARLFRSVIKDDMDTPSGDAEVTRRKTGFTPSLSLAWTPHAGTMVFARYAAAFRPGGLSSANSTGQKYEADELSTFELGTRLSRDAGRLVLTASLYQTLWQDIQSDYLLTNGLIATRNAGNGHVLGAEISASWKPARDWTLEAGALVQRTRLLHPAPGFLVSDDRRLPVVPDVTTRAGITRHFTLPGWTIDAALHANYIGRAHLSFDPGLDRKMGHYGLIDFSLGARSGHWVIGGTVSNLLNSDADSFAFGNPFSVRVQDQYTPLRPRTFRLTIGRQW